MKHLRKNKLGPIYAAAIALLLLSILLGLFLGATEVGFADVLKALFHGDTDSPQAKILWFVRLPRVAAGERLCTEDFTVLGEGGLCLNCEVCTFPNCGFGK